jgi:hypothetical protein
MSMRGTLITVFIFQITLNMSRFSKHSHSYKHTHTHSYNHTHTHIHTHTYTHTYTHTHTYTRKHIKINYAPTVLLQIVASL